MPVLPRVVVDETELPEGKPWWMVETDGGWVLFVHGPALRVDPGPILDGYGRALRQVLPAPTVRQVASSGLAVACQVVGAVVTALV